MLGRQGFSPLTVSVGHLRQSFLKVKMSADANTWPILAIIFVFIFQAFDVV